MTGQKAVGNIVRVARQKMRLTQLELAGKVGVHPNTIARIERGVQKPTFATAKRLARVLDLDIKDIPA